MPVLVKRGKSCEPPCVFITSAVFTRRLAIVHQQRCTLLSQERSGHLSNLDFGVLTIWVTLRIASGSGDLTAQVWNASDGKNIFTYKGHSAIVNAVAWSPNRQWIASGSGDKTVQVWIASDEKNIFTYNRME